MTQQETDRIYMRRCLQLAANGAANARPNPMVGAVIVADGKIIGEGYHVRCGEAHAEVNAFASVKPQDRHLLHDATIYVSLEPCAHYGKTPPCAQLIARMGVKRCVAGCVDPFAKVKGKGLEMIRNAGIEVTTGVLEEECRWLNRRFMVFHQHKRPYIILKWAQTANGYTDDNFRQTAISTPFTRMLAHKLRAECDAIAVGRVTAERDRPRLDTRLWGGKSPLPIVIDKSRPPFDTMDSGKPLLPQLLDWLYDRNCQSLIVEGGTATTEQFINANLWDEIRVETAPMRVTNGTKAPALPHNAVPYSNEQYDGNTIIWYKRGDTADDCIYNKV